MRVAAKLCSESQGVPRQKTIWWWNKTGEEID